MTEKPSQSGYLNQFADGEYGALRPVDAEDFSHAEGVSVLERVLRELSEDIFEKSGKNVSVDFLLQEALPAFQAAIEAGSKRYYAIGIALSRVKENVLAWIAERATQAEPARKKNNLPSTVKREVLDLFSSRGGVIYNASDTRSMLSRAREIYSAAVNAHGDPKTAKEDTLSQIRKMFGVETEVA